jgi:fused signal recognition particle receptor
LKNSIKFCKKKFQVCSETNTGEATEVIKIKKKPYVLMVVGVNGVGKTTTIGKLRSI